MCAVSWPTKIRKTARHMEADRQGVPSGKRDRWSTEKPSELENYIPAKRRFKTNRKASEES